VILAHDGIKVLHIVLFGYDFGLWWGLLGDTTSIFMVQNLYEVYSSLAHMWRQVYYYFNETTPFYILDLIFIGARLCDGTRVRPSPFYLMY
jgi:hypothetical protein